MTKFRIEATHADDNHVLRRFRIESVGGRGCRQHVLLQSETLSLQDAPLGAGMESIFLSWGWISGVARFTRAPERRHIPDSHVPQTKTIRLSACRVLRARRSVRPSRQCCAGAWRR